MIVARDFYLTPEELASVHLFEKVKWPAVVSIGELILGIGFLAALGVYVGLAARGRALGRVAGPDLVGRERAPPPPRRAASSSSGAGACRAPSRSPSCSRCTSRRASCPSSRRTSRSSRPSSRTRASPSPATRSRATTSRATARASTAATTSRTCRRRTSSRSSCAIRAACSRSSRRTTSRRSTRAFKRGHQDYFVLDASSSRFLLISNQLAQRRDRREPAQEGRLDGAHAASGPTGEFAPNETPPWKWRVPVSATFGDEIELVGADFPETVRRPGQDPARPHLPHQEGAARRLQDLHPLRRARGAARDRRPRSPQQGVPDWPTGCRASTSATTTRRTCRS